MNKPTYFGLNQVKGKNITATFIEEELRLMDVSGNAESVYYALDEFGAYVGVSTNNLYGISAFPISHVAPLACLNKTMQCKR